MRLKKIEKAYKDKYVVEAVFMHGDASMYEGVDFPYDSFEETKKFTDFAHWYFGLKWNARIDFKKLLADDLEIKKLYYRVFTSSCDDDDDDMEDCMNKDWGDHFWPLDKTCDGCGDTMLDGYNVYYYDVNGQKFLAESDD